MWLKIVVHPCIVRNRSSHTDSSKQIEDNNKNISASTYTSKYTLNKSQKSLPTHSKSSLFSFGQNKVFEMKKQNVISSQEREDMTREINGLTNRKSDYTPIVSCIFGAVTLYSFSFSLPSIILVGVLVFIVLIAHSIAYKFKIEKYKSNSLKELNEKNDLDKAKEILLKAQQFQIMYTLLSVVLLIFLFVWIFFLLKNSEWMTVYTDYIRDFFKNFLCFFYDIIYNIINDYVGRTK